MHPTGDNLSVTISEDFRKQGFSYTAGESAKRAVTLQYPKKLQMLIICNPVFLLHGMYIYTIENSHISMRSYVQVYLL